MPRAYDPNKILAANEEQRRRRRRHVWRISMQSARPYIHSPVHISIYIKHVRWSACLRTCARGRCRSDDVNSSRVLLSRQVTSMHRGQRESRKANFCKCVKPPSIGPTNFSFLLEQLELFLKTDISWLLFRLTRKHTEVCVSSILQQGYFAAAKNMGHVFFFFF